MCRWLDSNLWRPKLLPGFFGTRERLELGARVPVEAAEAHDGGSPLHYFLRDGYHLAVGAVSAAGLSSRKVVDVTGVPIGARRDAGIGAPALVVHPSNHPMVAVLEAHVDGVDLVSRDQGAIQELPARLRLEERRVGGRDLREQPQRARPRPGRRGLVCWSRSGWPPRGDWSVRPRAGRPRWWR